MVILGIETSTPHISVALLREDTLLCEISADGRGRQPLLYAIEQALALGEVSRQELDGIAYAKGPGAFTGLRVGLATAKGLAYALQKPLVGVSTLLAFAHSLSTRALVAPLLDAKKGEVYGALYRPESKEELLSEQVAPPERLAEALTKASGEEVFLCVGDGAPLLERLLPPRAILLGGLWPRASSVARLGAQALQRGEIQSPVEATPTYLRLPEALVKASQSQTQEKTVKNPNPKPT